MKGTMKRNLFNELAERMVSKENISCMIKPCDNQYEMLLITNNDDGSANGYELCDKHYDLSRNDEEFRKTAQGKSGRKPRLIDKKLNEIYRSIPEELRMMK